MAFRTVEAIDTNILVRLAVRDNAQQCLRIQDLFMRQGVKYEVTDLAISEAVYVLLSWYRWSRQDIVETLQTILTTFPLQWDHELFERVFPMYLSHPHLSFNDCCLAGYAALKEAEPLWTFDQDLAKESGTAKLLA